jgi:hypothetical protein
MLLQSISVVEKDQSAGGGSPLFQAAFSGKGHLLFTSKVEKPAILHWVCVEPDLWLEASALFTGLLFYGFVSLLSGFCSTRVEFV